MKNFENYVLDWFEELVDDHMDDNQWCESLMTQWLDIDNISEYFDDEEDADMTAYDWLSGRDDADEVYKKLYGDGADMVHITDLPSKFEFLRDMFMQAAEGLERHYSFVEALVEDMAVEADGYGDDAAGYFRDVQTGGCMFGAVGMFIYNDSCKRFYIEHINSMEDYMERLNDEMETPLHNTQHLPHYTWLCWVCYEDLAYRVYSNLFEQ